LSSVLFGDSGDVPVLNP